MSFMNIVKIILLIPILISAAFGLMIISYLAVPLVIVVLFGILSKALNDAQEEL